MNQILMVETRRSRGGQHRDERRRNGQHKDEQLGAVQRSGAQHLDDQQGDDYPGGEAGAPQPTRQCTGVVCPESAGEAAYFAGAIAGRLSQLAGPSSGGAINVVMIDGQPCTGGLDVMLDLESVQGPRWSSLCAVGGSIDGPKLLGALPARGGVAVLSHAQGVTLWPPSEGRLAVCEALRAQAEHTVITMRPDDVELARLCDSLVLLMHGSVSALAAAQQCVDTLRDHTSIGLVALETAGATRMLAAEALEVPLIASAPTRWRLSGVCAADVLAGAWPGSSDRTMKRLIEDSASFVASQGRCLAWV